jgi:hypothetical protein
MKAAATAVTGMRRQHRPIKMKDRIFLGEDQQWYFNVRGNQAVGPFDTSQAAAEALAEHVRSCKRRFELTLPWPSDWRGARLFRRPPVTAKTG